MFYLISLFSRFYIVVQNPNCTTAPPVRCDIYNEDGYTVNSETKRGCISPDEAGLQSVGTWEDGVPKLVCKVEGSGEWAVCNEDCYRPDSGHNMAITCCSGEDCSDECEEVERELLIKQDIWSALSRP